MFDPFAEAEELDRGHGSAPVQVSIDDYNEVCQLYEAAYLKLAVARLLDEHVSLTWCLLLVEAEGRSVAGMLVVELDASRWSLKRSRRPALTIQRRQLPICLELVAPVFFFFFICSFRLYPVWGISL
ncbi:hypothetical protein JCGZ_26473 [Jatropha curcas]|uniref:Uncharacterized protein n=1 Tax=Jatropha curcas TaxID=180498 RepID=A0A067L808_JATCU|nr:hypothetical protein JCGZ_26473 [Jatropha curcas]